MTEERVKSNLVSAVVTLLKYCNSQSVCSSCYLFDKKEHNCVMSLLDNGFDDKVIKWAKTMQNNEIQSDYLFAARDKASGKLVSDITNPRRKYWDKRGNAVNAIKIANELKQNLHPQGIELVKFKLVEEVEDEEINQ